MPLNSVSVSNERVIIIFDNTTNESVGYYGLFLFWYLGVQMRSGWYFYYFEDANASSLVHLTSHIADAVGALTGALAVVAM
jgi:hypothetical protein